MMQNDFIPNKNLHIALNELEKDDFINKKYIQQYIKENIHYWSNMFIVPKNIFFVYCDWIFRLAFNIQTKIELINPSIAEKRIIAYIIENLLSGVFWTYLKKHKKYEIVSKEILFIENADLKKEIFPAFNSNNIAIVFCVDKNYMKYVAVTIQSILSNTTLNNNYDILILGNGLSIYNKKQCLEMIKNYHNVSLRFYDIDIYLKEYKIDEYTTFGWYTNAIFYRYLIPIILKNYEKVLYLDSDLIVLEDISIIYNTDLNNNMIGAVRDIELQRWVKNNLYDNRCLLLECDKDKYFSSGVLLMNITKMRREGITEKLLKKHKILLTKSKLHLADQDIFNAVCYNDVTFIGTEWNMQWVVNNRVRDYFKELGEKDFYNYKSAFSKPKIIHYCDFEKPWTHPHLELSAYFWHYARQTPFYEEIIYKNTNIINNIQNNIQNNNNNNNDFSVILKPIYIFSYIYYYFKYYRCKILREITFGKKKKHYKEKCKILKENINSIKKLK
jgi:lipopolysaccharide biosynthesis glycosyltransferase